MGVLMEMKNSSVRFDTQNGVIHAVNGVSYALHKGETFGVVGESESGKSFHVLSILRLIPDPDIERTRQHLIVDATFDDTKRDSV